jgi:hypothetical protein
MSHVDSASDDRTANNAVRHQYRVLSEDEKAKMVAVKDAGAAFLTLLDSLATPPVPVEGQPGMAMGTFDRELHIARERIEEATMWAVKHITADRPKGRVSDPAPADTGGVSLRPAGA